MPSRTEEPPHHFLPEDDYFLEIESHFAEKRGTAFVISAKDWALLKSWKEGGIPLPILIEAIDGCFQKNSESGRRKTISSLSYCRHAVKDLWEERKSLQAGSTGSIPELDPGAGLALLANDLEQAALNSKTSSAAEALSATAIKVNGLNRKVTSVPDLEEKLIMLESALFELLRASLTPDEKAVLEQEASRALAGIADEKVRARTSDANLRRLIRKQFAIPRLSLFG